MFVDEPGSQEVRALVSQTDGIATSIVAYVEMWSALSRKLRSGEIQRAEYQAYLDQFEHYWRITTVVTLSEQLVASAARLTERHGLRALDAIHLASAASLARWSRELLIFSSADAAQLAAAGRQGLTTP
ncbi:MAG: type II toxin-antitoxin system VapC family toxin [Chloroflexi bacterium]|nr:type II toxin-antitoxin system VapC family toxin [Chloroflexota bacterium]